MKAITCIPRPVRFYFRWPSDGDSWFYFGPSLVSAFRFMKSEEYRIDYYGWHWIIGPLNFVLFKPENLG